MRTGETETYEFEPADVPEVEQPVQTPVQEPVREPVHEPELEPAQ